MASGHAAPRSEWREFLATIAIDLADAQLSFVDVPNRVRAGRPFHIRVTTYVGDCDRAGRNEVWKEGGVVHVRIYREYEIEEQIEGLDTPCTLQLGMPINDIQIPGLRAGVWEVRVEGMHSKRGVEVPLTISRFLVAE
jgi:hypothetical protein